MGFWQDKLAPAEAELPRADGAAYRAHLAQTSGSRIYAPTVAKPTAGDLYKDSPQYRGLDSYSRTPADKLAKLPGESDENWRRRTEVRRRAAEAEAHAEADKEAWAEHRDQLDNRAGTGTGIYGNTSPYDRAATVGGRGFGNPGLRGQGYHGHITVESLAANQPLSAVEVNAILAAREAERQQPQRTQTPTGSSRKGWMVSR